MVRNIAPYALRTTQYAIRDTSLGDFSGFHSKSNLFYGIMPIYSALEKKIPACPQELVPGVCSLAFLSGIQISVW